MIQGASRAFSDCAVACFSATCDNLLLWAHYADEAAGFCIGFKHNADFAVQSAYAGLTGPQAIRYRSALVRHDDMQVPPFLTKGLDWAYEQEIRCLRYLPEGKSDLMIPVTPDEIDCIIFGARASADAVIGVYDWAKEVPTPPKLLWALPSLTHYRMDMFDAPDKERMLDIISAGNIAHTLHLLPAQGGPFRPAR